MDKVLIVIDAQEDFTRGALRNEKAITALSKIHEAVGYAQEHDIPIVYTMDTHDDSYLETQEGTNLPVPHCITGTSGHNICPEAMIDESKAKKYPKFIKKKTFGTVNWGCLNFYSDAEIWMCGFCTDICVMANFQIIKALYPERKITIIEDACAGTTPTLHKAALKVMESCQAQVTKWDKLKNQPE